MTVPFLKVDYDLYSQNSLISVEGSTIRLILIELFFGTMEAYKIELWERNGKVQDW